MVSKEILNRLPLFSGVYLMKNDKGKVIYTGKAVCLRKRVQSYFRRQKQSDPRLDQLVRETVDIETVKTHSEAEALILEAGLIKKYKPKYNIDLKDDKSYPLVEITQENFPLIRVVRPNEEKRKKLFAGSKKSRYYGPYVGAHLLREALSVIRKIFPFRTCAVMKKRLCLDYHIDLCPGCCAGKISQKDYMKNVKRIRMILEGRLDILYHRLKQDMEKSAAGKNFEQAAKIRDQMLAVGSLYSGSAEINPFKEAEQLQRYCRLSREPERIEAFDISNLMGSQAVGSMVSFLNGRPDKKNYRRFRIRTVGGIDDCKMIAEVIRRRYARLKNEGLPYPDLILIDGGKGQLAGAFDELKRLDLDIPVLSLAKREEEVFLPRRRFPLRLPEDSLASLLLRRIRDEAHRFAISYHRRLRRKEALDDKS